MFRLWRGITTAFAYHCEVTETLHGLVTTVKWQVTWRIHWRLRGCCWVSLLDLVGYRTEMKMRPFNRNQPATFPVGHILAANHKNDDCESFFVLFIARTYINWVHASCVPVPLVPLLKKSVDYFFIFSYSRSARLLHFRHASIQNFPLRYHWSRQVSLVVGLLHFRLQTDWLYSGISSRVHVCETVIPPWLGP
jgi:hypothetical protein